LKDFKN